MAVVAGFVGSAWDRPDQRVHAFPGQQLTNRMIRANLGITYYSVARKWMHVVLMYYARRMHDGGMEC